MEDATPTRRDEIDDLLRQPVLMESQDRSNHAQVLALLEIVDAIDRLTAEVEKAGWRQSGQVSRAEGAATWSGWSVK